jgi:hypothetical protein
MLKIIKSSCNSFNLVEIIIGLVWIVPVIIKIFYRDEFFVQFLAIIATVISIRLTFTNSFSTLISLPYLTLLSPMAGYFYIFGGKLLLSDIFFIFLLLKILLFYLIKDKGTLSIYISSKLLSISAFYILSLFFSLSLGYIIGLKPLVYLIQLFIIYNYTNLYATTNSKKYSIINSWISACILGSFILIEAYSSGQDLGSVLIDDSIKTEDTSLLTYFFQARYYYSGFIFLASICCVYFWIKLLCPANYILKTTYFLLFLTTLTALIFMNNKTVLFSLIVVFIVIIIILIKMGIISKFKVFFTFSSLMMLAIFLLIPGYLYYFGENQFQLMTERFTSSSSLIARTEVYSTAFNQWLFYPIQIFFGMGPDFLDGSGASEIAINFKKSSITGLVEGTVDSGWFSYLIELGIIPFLILVSLYYQSIRGAFNILRRSTETLFNRNIGLFVFSSLLLTGLALFTQMLGYTKTLWFPFQLLLFGIMLHRDNNFKHKNG